MLSAILLCPLNSFAQDICFYESVASRIIVALEQAKITEQQLTVASGINVELQQQLEILRTSVKLLEDQIVVYKNMDEMKAQMSAAKDDLFKEQLKAAQPSFMDKAKSNVLAGGVGALLAVVVILLL